MKTADLQAHNASHRELLFSLLLCDGLVWWSRALLCEKMYTFETWRYKVSARQWQFTLLAAQPPNWGRPTFYFKFFPNGRPGLAGNEPAVRELSRLFPMASTYLISDVSMRVLYPQLSNIPSCIVQKASGISVVAAECDQQAHSGCICDATWACMSAVNRKCPANNATVNSRGNRWIFELFVCFFFSFVN